MAERMVASNDDTLAWNRLTPPLLAPSAGRRPSLACFGRSHFPRRSSLKLIRFHFHPRAPDNQARREVIRTTGYPGGRLSGVRRKTLFKRVGESRPGSPGRTATRREGTTPSGCLALPPATLSLLACPRRTSAICCLSRSLRRCLPCRSIGVFACKSFGRNVLLGFAPLSRRMALFFWFERDAHRRCGQQRADRWPGGDRR